MNYELFYKMIKEAQTDTPSPPKAPAASTALTATPADSQPTSTTPPQPTPVTSTNAYKPSPAINSGDVYGMVKNKPVPGMKPVPTAEQLANRWIQEKEDFYHNKADKYPQYANWHVSNQTRAHLMQQAQDMIKEHPEEAARIWAQDPYNSKNPTSVYRDEAFQYGTDQGWKRLKDEQAKAKEEAVKQNAPMQNPVASAAIGNTAMPIGSGENGFNQILNGGERAYYEHWSPYPDLNSPQYSEEYRTWLANNDALKAALRPLFPESIPNRNLTQEWFRFQQSADRGRIGANDLPMMQELYSKALNSTNQYPEIKQFFTGEDGAQLNILQAAQKAGAMQARGEQPPTALKPYWRYLLSVNSRFPQ